jgi:hypothetical protein
VPVTQSFLELKKELARYGNMELSFKDQIEMEQLEAIRNVIYI